jgi:seryl-tRNA synthetase
MTDGNTYAINKHLDEREDYDELQEALAELQQAEADNMMLIKRIEELEAENKNLRSMVDDVIADTGDDPEIMAASRAEWAARTFTAEAKLAKALTELERLGFDFQSILGRELKGQDDE